MNLPFLGFCCGLWLLFIFVVGVVFVCLDVCFVYGASLVDFLNESLVLVGLLCLGLVASYCVGDWLCGVGLM